MTHHNDSYMPGAATVVFIAAAILLLPWLGETMFNSKGEPREAIVAVSMLQGGNWLLPVNFGTDIPFKPPFLAWLIAIFAKLFNGGVVNEYISRLPSALAAIAMVMAGYHWASRVRGPRFAIIFSFVTLTCVEVFRAAVACRLDMVLTACMVIAMYMLYDLGERKGRLRWLRYIGVVLLLSCATMTKGPVGTLLPCLIVGIYRLLRRDRFFAVVGKLVVIAVASLLIPAMWYYAAYLQGGREFYDLMLEENIGRLTGTMSYESHVNPWYYNFMTLAGIACRCTFRASQRPSQPLVSGCSFQYLCGGDNRGFLLHTGKQTQRVFVAGLSLYMLWHRVASRREGGDRPGRAFFRMVCSRSRRACPRGGHCCPICRYQRSAD